jgi:hypothetical protein
LLSAPVLLPVPPGQISTVNMGLAVGWSAVVLALGKKGLRKSLPHSLGEGRGAGWERGTGSRSGQGQGSAQQGSARGAWCQGWLLRGGYGRNTQEQLLEGDMEPWQPSC